MDILKEKEVLDAIQNGVHLKDNELFEVIQLYSIRDEEKGSGHQITMMRSIIELDGNLFGLDWERGDKNKDLNIILNQPYKVKEHTYPKTITITEYIKDEE